MRERGRIFFSTLGPIFLLSILIIDFVKIIDSFWSHYLFALLLSIFILWLWEKIVFMSYSEGEVPLKSEAYWQAKREMLQADLNLSKICWLDPKRGEGISIFFFPFYGSCLFLSKNLQGKRENLNLEILRKRATERTIWIFFKNHFIDMPLNFMVYAKKLNFKLLSQLIFIVQILYSMIIIFPIYSLYRWLFFRNDKIYPLAVDLVYTFLNFNHSSIAKRCDIF